jgi:hypothetical protein
LLAVAAGLQLALTGGDTELPEPGWLGGGARTSLPQFGIGGIPAPLREVTMFDPVRSASGAVGGAAAAPTGPLGGAAVAGSISVRGRTFAIIQLPNGQVGRLPLGGRLGGLRLIALNPDAAVFQSGSKRVRVPYGSASFTPVVQAGDSEEESQ